MRFDQLLNAFFIISQRLHAHRYVYAPSGVVVQLLWPQVLRGKEVVPIATDEQGRLIRECVCEKPSEVILTEAVDLEPIEIWCKRGESGYLLRVVGLSFGAGRHSGRCRGEVRAARPLDPGSQRTVEHSSLNSIQLI